MNDTCFECIDTPIGELFVVVQAGALTSILFPDQSRPTDIQRNPTAMRAVSEQLRAYFAGELQTFDLPCLPSGTEFQQKVWAELRRIEFGQTLSYGALATRIGRPSASRAVGLANGKNPIPIVIPCHRVIGANGSLTGFSGGIERKRWLLEHEAMQRSLL